MYVVRPVERIRERSSCSLHRSYLTRSHRPSPTMIGLRRPSTPAFLFSACRNQAGTVCMRDAKLRRAEVRGHDMTARRQATRGEIAWTPPIAWDSTSWNFQHPGITVMFVLLSRSRGTTSTAWLHPSSSRPFLAACERTLTGRGHVCSRVWMSVTEMMSASISSSRALSRATAITGH